MSLLKDFAEKLFNDRQLEYKLDWERFFIQVKEAVPKEVMDYVSLDTCKTYDVIRKPREEFFHIENTGLPTILVRAAIIEQYQQDYVDYSGKRKNTSTTLQVLFCVETDRDWSDDFEWVLAKAYRQSLKEEAAKEQVEKPKNEEEGPFRQLMRLGYETATEEQKAEAEAKFGKKKKSKKQQQW